MSEHLELAEQLEKQTSDQTTVPCRLAYCDRPLSSQQAAGTGATSQLPLTFCNAAKIYRDFLPWTSRVRSLPNSMPTNPVEKPVPRKNSFVKPAKKRAWAKIRRCRRLRLGDSFDPGAHSSGLTKYVFTDDQRELYVGPARTGFFKLDKRMTWETLMPDTWPYDSVRPWQRETGDWRKEEVG